MQFADIPNEPTTEEQYTTNYENFDEMSPAERDILTGDFQEAAADAITLDDDAEFYSDIDDDEALYGSDENDFDYEYYDNEGEWQYGDNQHQFPHRDIPDNV